MRTGAVGIAIVGSREYVQAIGGRSGTLSLAGRSAIARGSGTAWLRS